MPPLWFTSAFGYDDQIDQARLKLWLIAERIVNFESAHIDMRDDHFGHDHEITPLLSKARWTQKRFDRLLNRLRQRQRDYSLIGVDDAGRPRAWRAGDDVLQV